MKTKKQWPVSLEVATGPRRMPLDHIWNRGYPNNKKLVALRKSFDELKQFRRGMGFVGRRNEHGEETKKGEAAPVVDTRISQ